MARRHTPRQRELSTLYRLHYTINIAPEYNGSRMDYPAILAKFREEMCFLRRETRWQPHRRETFITAGMSRGSLRMVPKGYPKASTLGTLKRGLAMETMYFTLVLTPQPLLAENLSETKSRLLERLSRLGKN